MDGLALVADPSDARRWRLSGPGPALVSAMNAYLGYLADRNYSPRTVRTYGFGLLALARWLTTAGLTVDDLRTSDITYLATGQGWLYLCAVRDGCSRRVIGYAFSDSLHTDVVEDALRRAVSFRDRATGSTEGVIFHADRGCQYTSAQLARFADRHNLARSVGRTGVCWDNAAAESFWATLKVEFYDRYLWPSRAAAKLAVGDWIERVYNRRRRHSALGMISPVDYEGRFNQTAQAA